MVIKNQTIGNVKEVTLIELGSGDVKVSCVKQFDEKYTGVMFCNDKPNPVGTDHVGGGTTDEYDLQVMLTFTNIESIEVVEKHLKRAKTYLKQIIK